MHILYGVAGQGSGHASRSREVLRHLVERGHDVSVVASDAAYDALHNDFTVARIAGLRLDYHDNRVRYVQTILRNTLRAPEAAKSVEIVRRIIRATPPAIVLSDFEPICGALAKLKRLPLIAIDNIHVLTRTAIAYPRHYATEARAALAVTRLMNARSDAYVIPAFAPTTATKPKTFLVPPILRREILAMPPRKPSQPRTVPHVLVYCTSQYDDIVRILRPIRATFIIYGLERSARIGNCTLKRRNDREFLIDLHDADAVVANAGFTLITEALYLGVPYLALPVRAQFEQIVNAYALEELGYGRWWDALNRERVEAFLYNRGRYVQALRTYPRQDNAEAFRVIDQLVAAHTSSKT